MQYLTSDPVDTRDQAQELAQRIKDNACPYRGVYNVKVAQVGGTNGRPIQWVVTFYRGSL